MPDLFNASYSRTDLMRRIGHLSQVGGVQLLTAGDGPGRGVRLIEFRTGTGFTFKVAVERGMDIGYCEYRGRLPGLDSAHDAGRPLVLRAANRVWLAAHGARWFLQLLRYGAHRQPRN